MINYSYQLISPRAFSIKFSDMDLENQVIVKPKYMAICHADQRYYTGMRDPIVLRRKLPMALIHECCGIVAHDPTGHFHSGDTVVLIPNIPAHYDDEFYENYGSSGFHSSTADGFMQEYVALPYDRVISYQDVPPQIAAITEFISVGFHSLARLQKTAHSHRESFGIWGDGSLGFIMASILKYAFPKASITVIGKTMPKLTHFSFVDHTYLINELPDNFQVDHAFECAGGNGCEEALKSIVAHIKPQGCIMMMGVSETPVPINTRDILEKGVTCIGCSRSGRIDFENAIHFLQRKDIQSRYRTIITEDKPVQSIADIHRVFQTDLGTPFKTVFEWKL